MAKNGKVSHSHGKGSLIIICSAIIFESVSVIFNALFLTTVRTIKIATLLACQKDFFLTYIITDMHYQCLNVYIIVVA